MLVGSRQAGLLVAAVVLALGAAMPAATAVPQVSSATPGWRLVKTFGCGEGVVVVTAHDPRGAWATGFTTCPSFSPLIARWNGRSWQQLQAPLRFASYGAGPAASLSSTYAWTFPAGRFALLWNNGRWRWYRLSHHSLFVDAAVAFSRSDAWSFEWEDGPGQRYAFHFDGHAWRRMLMPVSPQEAAAPGPHNIWAVGPLPKYPDYSLAHWTGRHWRAIPLPSLHLPVYHYIEAWVVSDGSAGAWVTADIGASDFQSPAVVLLHWTGRTWIQVTVPFQVDTLGPLAHDGHGGLWIASDLSQNGHQAATAASNIPRRAAFDWAMLHYSAAGTWSETVLPANVDSVYSMRLIPGTSSLWAGTQVVLRSHVIAAIFKYGR